MPEKKDYYLPDAMADKTIEWLHGVRAQAPDKPFFVYFSTGRQPRPAPRADRVERQVQGEVRRRAGTSYREETFARQKQLGVIPPDAKLTAATRRDARLGGLADELKQLYARQMEVYAGFQENADYNVGRVVDAIDAMGELDNTLVFYIWGDNGASMEGTPTGTFNELTMQNGHPADGRAAAPARRPSTAAWTSGARRLIAPHYAAAWAWAGNCPFQWGKQVASHLGGTRDRMVVPWPRRIKEQGGLRKQFTHVIDIGPTILEAVGLPAPSDIDGIEQKPMHGTSFLYTFDDEEAAERHTQQYFEIFGNRAMYKDGWWAACKLAADPLGRRRPRRWRGSRPTSTTPRTTSGSSTTCPTTSRRRTILAAQHPEKLEELKELFWKEAEKYKVTPLLARVLGLLRHDAADRRQTKFTYHGRVQNVAPGMIPRIYNRSYTISADLEIPHDGVEGVIVAEADHLGGFSLFVQDGRLKHTYSMMGVAVYRQEATEPLPSGRVNVRLEFAADAPKMGTGGKVAALRQRPQGRRGADGAHRPGPLLGLRGHGHRPRQRPAGRPQLRRQLAVRVHRHDPRGHLRPRAAPTDDDEQELHEHAQQALAAHAIHA